MKPYNKPSLVEDFLYECGKVADTPAVGNEIDIAKKICRNLIEGKIHEIEIPNASAEQRKRLVAIAYQLIKDRPLWCRIFGTHDGENCCDCGHVCSCNRVLIRRFTEEMFPGRGV